MTAHEVLLQYQARLSEVAAPVLERGAIGALSTHDLALTELAGDDALGGGNVHMSTKAIPWISITS